MTNTEAPVTGRGPRRPATSSLATWTFAITFWAWNLIAPLGVRYTEELGLSSSAEVAPGRDPCARRGRGPDPGRRPDRPLRRAGRCSPCSALPRSYRCCSWRSRATSSRTGCCSSFGFLLGIAGTTFAAGIPFVNAWYEPARRGFATGVFGAGMGGTALSAFFTPRFVRLVRLHRSARHCRGRARGHGLPGAVRDAGLTAVAAEAPIPSSPGSSLRSSCR